MNLNEIRASLARHPDNEAFQEKVYEDFVVDTMGITRADVAWFFWRNGELYVRQLNRLKTRIDPAAFRLWRAAHPGYDYRAGTGS